MEENLKNEMTKEDYQFIDELDKLLTKPVSITVGGYMTALGIFAYRLAVDLCFFARKSGAEYDSIIELIDELSKDIPCVCDNSIHIVREKIPEFLQIIDKHENENELLGEDA